MKITQFFVLSLIVLSSISCAKKQQEKPQEDIIDETNLTTCPAQTVCQYIFKEHADVIQDNRAFKSGNYRVFWANFQNNPNTVSLYIKAPMEGDRFLLGKPDLLKGAVVSFNGCPSCNTVDMEIVDGYVKGFNLTPDAKVGQKKWLLEFKLYLEAVETYEIRDTIYVKQYFYPSFTDN